MHLTFAQLATLKAHILASGDLNSLPNNGDGNSEIARLLNLTASPSYIVWKRSVSLVDVGQAFVASSLSAMSATNNDRLVSFALWNPGGVSPERADHRTFFDDVFSPASGAPTRAALLALWKRQATRFERLYTTGTGSDASPGALGPEGPVDESHVQEARNLP